MNITELLKLTNELEASDLHLTVGVPPTLRVNGLLSPLEIMIAIPAIRNIIREERIHMISATIQSSQQHGMQTIDQSLRQLYQNHIIDKETALSKASDTKFVVSH